MPGGRFVELPLLLTGQATETHQLKLFWRLAPTLTVDSTCAMAWVEALPAPVVVGWVFGRGWELGQLRSSCRSMVAYRHLADSVTGGQQSSCSSSKSDW